MLQQYVIDETTQRYLNDLSDSKYQPIPIEIERELIKASKQGNKKAEKQLIEAHLRLVVTTAKRYKNLGVNLNDLIQEGNLGLYEALKRFSPEKDVRFCAYAEWWIRKYVLSTITKENHIHTMEEFSEFTKTSKSSIDDEAEELDIFDNMVENESNKEEYNTESLKTLFEGMDARSRYVIESNYGLIDSRPKSFIEISQKLGITPQRVRQIKLRAMATLRRNALANKIFMSKKSE